MQTVNIIDDNTLVEGESPSRKTAFTYQNFASLASLITKDLNKATKTKKFFSKYTKEQVIKYLENPESAQKQLRAISDFLYVNSSHYRRLVNYFSKMPTYAYVVESYNHDETVNKKKYKAAYTKVLNMVDNMNIKHEFVKVLNTAFRTDIFYGYEYSTADSYYIRPLDPDYCEINGYDDGCPTFCFDFTYFSKYPQDLDSYPSEFKTKYDIFKADKMQRWVELDSKYTICIKINEDIPYPIIPFAGVLENLYDIQDYKALRKASTEADNYKLIGLEIPMRENSESLNDFLLDEGMIKAFFKGLTDVTPEQIGAFVSPMKIKEIDFKSSKTADVDSVAKAERDFWSSAGVSELIFNSENGTGASLTRSIQSDEQLVFGVLRQLERWINKKIKYMDLPFNFRVNMLNVTSFNIDKSFEMYVKGAMYGVPVKSELCALLGVSPSAISTKAFLENVVLQLTDKFEPLKSSSTMSPDKSEVGSPTKSDGDLSDTGITTKEQDANNPDNRA